MGDNSHKSVVRAPDPSSPLLLSSNTLPGTSANTQGAKRGEPERKPRVGPQCFQAPKHGGSHYKIRPKECFSFSRLSAEPKVLKEPPALGGPSAKLPLAEAAGDKGKRAGE